MEEETAELDQRRQHYVEEGVKLQAAITSKKVEIDHLINTKASSLSVVLRMCIKRETKKEKLK